MAIAPSRLGQFVLENWTDDAALLRSLRGTQLVKRSVQDEEVIGAVRRAISEHLALPEGDQQFNSPHERVRVFLAPLLTVKGRAWAVPLKSLKPWWRFWG